MDSTKHQTNFKGTTKEREQNNAFRYFEVTGNIDGLAGSGRKLLEEKKKRRQVSTLVQACSAHSDGPETRDRLRTKLLKFAGEEDY